MFNHNNRLLLQLFAGEGATGEGGAEAAGAGETGADAGHQRLRSLGVPENRIRKSRTGMPPAGSQEAAAPGTPRETAEPQSASSRMSWEEILKDPEYNAQMQKIIRSRVKEEGRNRAALETLEPAIRHLAKQHGLDPDNVDHTALVKAVTGEYAAKAQELGIPQKTAMELDQQQRQLQKERMQNHLLRLQQQEQAFRAVVPGFELGRELGNPLFARLVSPSVGLSVEDAFYAVHRRAMQEKSMQVAAQQTSRMISNAIRSGDRRPEESGAQAPSVSRFDYRSATPEQRKALKDAIYKAAAEGRKIYPG